MDEPMFTLEECGARIESRNPTGRGVKRAKGVRLRDIAPKTCEQCGATFTKSPKETYGYFQAKRYCASTCHDAARRGVTTAQNAQVPMSCLECGAAFTAAPWQIKAGRRFCGRPCTDKHRNQGLTPAPQRERQSAAGRAWRLAVFERDDWTCQICGARGAELNADHIKPFALFPELRFDVDNGRTLCVPCHRKTDTYGINLVFAMRKAAMSARAS